MASESINAFYELLLTGNESGFRQQLETELAACMNRLAAENAQAGRDQRYRIARAALHYDCPSFAQWLRATWTNRSADLDYQPFAREGYVSKSHWERSYNNVQPGINWFTTFASEKPLRVLFQGEPSSIEAQVESLLFVISPDERSLLRDFLHKVDLIEWYDHLQAALYEGTIVEDPSLERHFESPCDRKGAIIQEMSDFADRLYELRKPMRWEPYPAGRPSDTEPPVSEGSVRALKAAYLISFLYTWYPNITATVANPYDSWHGLALGLRVPQESNPELINARISAVAMLDPRQHSRSADVDRVTHDIEQQLRRSLESVVQQLCSIELKTITRKPPAVSLDLERTIRALANPTKPASRAHDTWFPWRDKFPKTERFTRRRRDVPLWGKSESMSALFNALEKKVAAHHNGVDTIFLYSPPGCGKEIIAKLCHFMSSSATDYAGVVQSAHVRLRDCASEDQVRLLLSRAIGRLNLSWKRDAWGNLSAPAGGELPEMWNEFLTTSHAKAFDAWDFNYFTIQGAEISAPSGNTKQQLIGSLGKDAVPESIGYLVRASFTHGTVFLDELNTMHPKDANLFLRLTEKPFKVNLDGYRGQFPLDVRIVFASNKKPEELIEMGWNEAVITRIAKPGSYFEIPPLRDRKEDIAVLASFLLLEEKMKQKKGQGPQLTSPPVGFDYDALRFLCETGWESGNYRDLISVWHQLLNRRGWMHLDPLIRLTEIQECIDEVRLGRQVRHHDPKPAQR